ncbi:hypothetical protein BJ123_13128 [Rhodopseudomonas thermotolerans]|uniref:Uncharacterized protein n=2 Tax=Rhodopseudomonas TaxID=1073 RepID=A0A336JUM0_9BRAD|nr:MULTISPECIES: hypothetical protein [Rhodopseudomonas]RED25560.1 hypothetical protein BJ125_13128 [Rhodopseudomonas pentothenatexigens]REF90390.1 hypothetical protein BJ123_13128 [Rhodopseudomonas thermotolerans]SSW93172.1 hypothetical protein SAMN05892882_13128 [Rhodopseudomonas pentothenatexigens]
MSAQLGFDALLSSADQINANRQVERESAHLPGAMEEALPFYRALIERHHAAMLAGDAAAVLECHREAHRLAEKLNGYEPGIIADEDAPGCVLDRETRAPDGAVPLWGQSGSFEITVGTMRARIRIDGLFGIASGYFVWPGFDARVVDLDQPFISETGYRSFLGISGALEPGHTPDSFAAAVVEAHVRRELKGCLLTIKPEYRR